MAGRTGLTVDSSVVGGVVGETEGISVGMFVGSSVVGPMVGLTEGDLDGVFVGVTDGNLVGIRVFEHLTGAV